MAYRTTFLLILFMTCCNCLWAQSGLEESTSVITAPTVSSKCRVLIEEREKRVKMKQTLSALIERNIKLQHLETKDLELKRKLIGNLRKLRNEYLFTKNKVRHLTSEIVITGCPGVTL